MNGDTVLLDLCLVLLMAYWVFVGEEVLEGRLRDL